MQVSNQIAVCGYTLHNVLSKMKSVGYKVIQTTADSYSILSTIQQYKPKIFAADTSTVSVADLVYVFTVISKQQIVPLCVIITDNPLPFASFDFVRCSNTPLYLTESDSIISFCEDTDMDDNIIIEEIPAPVNINNAVNTSLELKVTEVIQKMGIPANLKGYRYIRSAVVMASEDVSMLDSITKRLYPEIAKLYKTTPSRVERAIRHAITAAWERGKGDVVFMREKLHCEINFDDEKPTNSELIALISDCLRFYA